MLAEDIETTLRDYIESAYTNDAGDVDDEALKKAIEEITPSGKDLKGKFKNALCSYLKQASNSSLSPDLSLIDTVYQKHLHQPASVKKFENLTLSEYIQLFKNLWDNYKAEFKDLEWELIHNLLDQVRQTRNNIAHFREVTPYQREGLKHCINFLNYHRPTIENSEPQAIDMVPPKENQSNVSITENQTPASAQVTTDVQDPLAVEPNWHPLEEATEPDDSRYAPLAVWLRDQVNPSLDKVTLTFEQVENIIQDQLPSSARKHRAWWANDTVSHPQSQQWLEVGWRVSNVNISEERVIFSRMDERQGAYIEFFNNLLSKLQATQNLSIKPGMNLQGRHWFSVEITSDDVTDLTWIVFAFARKSRFRIELYIDKGDRDQNKQIFDMLYAQKAGIEEQFGAPLNWEHLDNRRGCRIATYRDHSSITNSAHELAELQDWATATMPRFYTAIAPYFHQLMATPQTT